MGFITDLLSALVAGITGIVEPMITAIKTGFEAVVYTDPTATTKTISTLGYFLFAMLGVSVGVGLVWLVISLFKRRG